MDNNGRNNNLGDQKNQKSDINLKELFQIILRRKKIIFVSTLSMFVFALLFNFLSTPIYEATVTLKKDVVNSKQGDEFKEMFQMQSSDELDTEIEIIKTRTVLEEIINELNLFIHIDKIEFVNGEISEPNIPLFIFETQNEQPLQLSNVDIDLNNPVQANEYYIQVTHSNTVKLYEIESDEPIQSVKYDSIAHFNFRGLQFDLKWPGRKTGDKIYFQTKNFESVFKSLKASILISKIEKTNIFTFSYRSPSPSAARIIANTIVDIYRENRLAQKRQSIHSSFEFVDNQLEEISEKLKNAELKLGQFKSENKITTMAESSTEILNFLSNLESEKVEIELQLAEYRDKVSGMNREQEKKGYVDQTYLSPGGETDRGSPFSVLLSQLSDAEIRRLELMQKRRASHPEVIAVDKQIAQIKTRLSEYNQNTMSSYQIIINTLRKKRYNLSRLIDKYSSRLENLPGQETTLVELMRDKNAFEKMYTLLLDKREELRMSEFSKFQDIIIVDQARLPFKPISPRKTLNIILGIFLGFVIGILTIFVIGLFEEKISDINDIEAEFPFSILAVIPQYSKEIKKTIDDAKNFKDKLVTLNEDHHEYLESYRLLRTRLLNFAKDKKKAFLFTSSEADTGKSTIVANLSISIVMTGKKVLLIDCDLKKAGLSNIFNVPKLHPNYLEHLSSESDFPVPFRPFKKMNPELDLNIFNAGYDYMENSSELFETDKMQALIKRVSKSYDFILIDTPPVTQVVDTLILGNYVQNVIYVAKPSHTYRESIKFAFEELQQSSMNVCGIVVNGGNLNRSSYKYKYGYQYGYGVKSG